MTAESLYRLHTDALDRQTLEEIADRILQRNPNQKVYIYDIEGDKDEIGMLKDALHEPKCTCGDCGECSGEDRALEQMEKGIVDAETNYGDR